MLTTGAKLGPYEIQSPLGAGGMGEVYRARDTRLGRDVAIKILPQHLASTPEARQRFEREARAVSSLNHPHICTLHDIGHQDGTDFLVMEFLEGETLSKRLEKGLLPTADLLRIAIEIADALEKAHRQGVIHRDLKPGNIMLTKGGAKLLDFGLAKAGMAPTTVDLSSSPTVSQPVAGSPLTAKGTIVGTFQYMAPEQLEGKEADARSDIFSFGAVLFEMATGKRAFEGKSQASVIAAILEREPPPISQLQPMSPPALDRVVRICLSKDPDDRFQTAHDLKLQLEWIRDTGSQAGVPAPIAARRRLHERFWIATTTLLTLVAALLGYGYIARAPQPAPAIVSQIEPPSNTKFVFVGFSAGPPALSPDGKRMVFSAVGSDGVQHLWIRPLDSSAAQPLEETENDADPFWSPDGRYLGFFDGHKLGRMDASGGPPLALSNILAVSRGGSWGRDGTILFAPSASGPISGVSASGGAPRVVTMLNASLGQTAHRWPQFLPDGKHFLYFAGPRGAEVLGTYAASLEGGEPRLILRETYGALYAPPGYLLFVRQGTLMAQRFDASKLQVDGDAMPLAEHIAVDESRGRAIFSASENGILTYQAGTEASGGSELLWFDRSGKQIGQTGDPGFYATTSISPDGSKLAASSMEPNTIWVYDIARGTRTRVTFGSTTDGQSSWSPDGKFIVFFSNRGGQSHIYQQAADGTGTTTPLVVDDASEQYPSISFDGLYLIFMRAAVQVNSRFQIWAMPLAGDRKPFPVVQSEFDTIWPALSPDGKWLAYVSDESGRFEVYVVPFLHGSGKLLVSTAGGTRPRWRRDGKELFYLSPDNKIMSAAIEEAGTSLAIGKVQPLFQANPAPNPGWIYDVSADGKKFLVVSQGPTGSAAPLTLVVNWPALLKKQQ